MKVLLIGDNPKIVGGVCNYTRPLFSELNKSPIETIYLYSASRLQADYRLFGRPKIVKDSEGENLFKIVNSANLDLNYDNIDLDTVSPENDRVVEIFLKTEKPDLVHINEMIGFSTEILKVCKKLGIKVVVTVHEYWWLCPKRVMVDYNRRVCEGPSDLEKCSHCLANVQKGYSSTSRVRSYKINNLLKKFGLLKYKKVIQSRFQKERNSPVRVPLSFGTEEFRTHKSNKRKLERRLSANTSALNDCERVICVSNDVKIHLERYGVKSEKLLVQHIGSEIADRKILHHKKISQDNVKFGFIGGVSYYKGVHQLVQAYQMLSSEEKKRSELHIFGSGSPDYIASLYSLAKIEIDQGKIFIHGRYEHEDLERITNSVDIAILPSLCADTAPQTIFESFSAGLPVIAPSVGGFSDFVKHEINGLIYEGSSAMSLSVALKTIIENPFMIDNFRSRIEKQKSMKIHIDEIANLYSDALDY